MLLSAFRLREFRTFLDDEPENRSWREQFYLWRLEHPFWRCEGASGAGVLFVPRFGDAPRWLKMLTYPVYMVGRWCHESRWWLAYRLLPRHNYTILRSDLEPGYHDFDTRILHCCMWALGEFLAHDGHHAETKYKKNAREIWEWWTKERAQNKKKRHEMMHELFGDGDTFDRVPVPDMPGLTQLRPRPKSAEWEARYEEFRALDKKIESDDQSYLHRLIAIRQYLWN